jgi:hypothetical protein
MCANLEQVFPLLSATPFYKINGISSLEILLQKNTSGIVKKRCLKVPSILRVHYRHQ